MEVLEQISFQIITSVGTAKSMYIEAIQKAKEGGIDEARDMIAEGEKVFVEGHHAHAKLLEMQGNGEKMEFNVLLMHAEDQLMSAEGFKTIAEEFVDLYERIL